jgi:sugar lactone lactonase YvrE
MRRTLTRAPLLAALACALVSVPALAVHTTYWTVTRAEDFEKGTLEHASLEKPGTVVLSPKATPLADPDALYAWALARDAGGNLFVGSGDGGVVYRIPEKGEAVEWFDTIEMEITALAFDREGRLYAGGSPDGTIFRITGKGEGATFADTPESYVWALAFDDGGNLYAATGTRGRIYKIGRDGKASVFYEAEDTNVLSLVYDAKRKALLAGTEGRGLVLEITLDGKGRVLFDSGHEEIGAVALASDGTIYIGGSGESDGGSRVKRQPKKKDETTSSPKTSDMDQDDSAAKANGAATVYRIATDGVVTRHWESNEEFIYALVVDKAGRLVAGTGSEGALYEVAPDGRATLLLSLDESQILDLVETPAGIVVSTGNLAKVYRIGPDRVAEGTSRSDVYDARNVARWGSISWRGETPDGTGITLRTRTGNTDKPDASWSDWSRPLERADGIEIPGGRSRFLQWEATLTGSKSATPRLSEVRVSFVEANLPPQVKSVEVFPQGTVFFEGDPDVRPKPLFQELPNGIRVEFSTEGREAQVWTEAENPWARGVRTMRWDATDPNADILSYDVFYRALDEDKWKSLKEEFDQNLFTWETESFPDGDYEVRIVASDRLDNPRGEELSGEGLSEPFAVDNTPPEILSISANREGERIVLRASARDERSFLRRALYAVDAEEWRPVGTKDGVFDARAEEFEIRTEPVEAGEHTVVLKVYDEHANARVGRAVVR